VSEAYLLFGPDVVAYIEQIYTRGLKLWRWNQDYRNKPAGYDRDRAVEEAHKELEWLSAQFDPAREIFARYLNAD
jgi:hypothetical protein